MATEWYCRIGTQDAGPFSPQAVIAMALDGRLRPTDLVRKGLDGSWVPAGSVQGLNFVGLQGANPNPNVAQPASAFPPPPPPPSQPVQVGQFASVPATSKPMWPLVVGGVVACSIFCCCPLMILIAGLGGSVDDTGNPNSDEFETYIAEVTHALSPSIRTRIEGLDLSHPVNGVEDGMTRAFFYFDTMQPQLLGFAKSEAQGSPNGGEVQFRVLLELVAAKTETNASLARKDVDELRGLAAQNYVLWRLLATDSSWVMQQLDSAEFVGLSPQEKQQISQVCHGFCNRLIEQCKANYTQVINAIPGDALRPDAFRKALNSSTSSTGSLPRQPPHDPVTIKLPEFAPRIGGETGGEITVSPGPPTKTK